MREAVIIMLGMTPTVNVVTTEDADLVHPLGESYQGVHGAGMAQRIAPQVASCFCASFASISI